MKILCTDQGLIQNVFFVNVFQNIFVNGVVEIGLHVLKNQVDITTIFGNKYLMKLDDILMFDFFENGDLSKSSLGVSGMLKSFEYFF